MTNPIHRLGVRIGKIEAQMRGFSRSPQLAHSSIEDGALQEYDGSGTLVSIIGKQYDGTHGAVVVSGPVPPTPTAPVLTGGLGLTGGWDGVFVDDSGQPDITIPSPLDYTRTELHLSRTKGFRADTADTLAGTLESPRGGSLSMLVEPGTWYAVLVARSASGKRSPQSAEAEAVVELPVGSDIDVDALRREFQDANETLQQALADNAAEMLTLTEGPMPETTAENIAGATGKFLKVSTNQLVAGTAALGEAVAKKFAADIGLFMKLTANQVFIGEAGNMERDPNFEQLDGWAPENIPPIIYRHAEGGYNKAHAMSFELAQDVAELSGAWRYDPDGRFSFPVTAGEKYRVSCWVQPDKDIPAQAVVLYLRASTLDGGFWGVHVPESAQNDKPIKAGVWTKITGTVTMPASATSAFLGYFRFPSGNHAKVRFSTPTVQQAITPSLIVDGFFKGLRVIGASVETNEAAETGVKMNDGGMTAYGKSAVNFAGVSKAFKVRANVDSRVNQWGVGATASLPGFWLEREPADGSSLPPQFPAGVTLTDTNARALRARSAMASITDPYSEVMLSPTEARLESYSQGVAGQPRGAVSAVAVSPTQFSLATVDAGFTPQAQVQHLGDGILRLHGAKGVYVNGNPITRIQEFKATGSKGHFEAANQSITTPVSQPGSTNSPGLVAPGAGTITILETGIYAIDFHVVWNAGMTGRSFVEISDGSNAYARNPIGVDEDQTLAALSGKLFTVGQRIVFRVLQSSGAARNYTATIRVTKHP